MKKSTKTSIITGIIIVVIGVVVLLCALGMSGWNFKEVNEWQENFYYSNASVSKLNVKVNAGKVVIKHSETDEIQVRYQFNDKYQPQFSENSGVLSIETAHKKWYEFNWWFNDAPLIEIHVPQNLTPEIDLELNAGTVQLGDGNWGKLIDVELNAGAITIGNVSVDELYLDVNAGAIDVQKIQCQKITCSISAGAFSAKEIICDAFECDISAGGVEVKTLDSRSIKVDVSAGSAELWLVGAKSDYNVSVDKSAGSCNISSQTSASASRTLTIDISAGSVEIGFGK